MPRPASPIPQELRERLDAAREWLDVQIDWVEPGDKRCWGRAFGFFAVQAGPYGWREAERQFASLGTAYGQGCPAEVSAMLPCGVETGDLARAIASILDLAAQRWPAPELAMNAPGTRPARPA